MLNLLGVTWPMGVAFLLFNLIIDTCFKNPWSLLRSPRVILNLRAHVWVDFGSLVWCYMKMTLKIMLSDYFAELSFLD